MKTDRYLIYQWRCTEPELDIDWPRVHQELGSECLRWLNEQTLDQCQLVVECQDTAHSLVVEFYCQDRYREFLLLKD